MIFFKISWIFNLSII